MTQLGERDFRAVLDFLGEAYDAQDRDEFRNVMLPGFRRLVPSDYASYNELMGTVPVATITVGQARRHQPRPGDRHRLGRRRSPAQSFVVTWRSCDHAAGP